MYKFQKNFPEEIEMQNCMLGSFANVAEVPYLRQKLLTQDVVTMLESVIQSDDFRVSYHAVSILANLVSDGQEAWRMNTPKRENILEKMTDTMSKWSLDADKGASITSFLPLIKLAGDFCCNSAVENFTSFHHAKATLESLMSSDNEDI